MRSSHPRNRSTPAVSNSTAQYTTDGTTWQSTGWSASPTYPYNTSSQGQTYAFTGTPLNNVKGVRIVGQVHTISNAGSWEVRVREFMAYANQGASIDGPVLADSLSQRAERPVGKRVGVRESGSSKLAKLEPAKPAQQAGWGATVATSYYYFGGQRVAMRKGGMVSWLHSDPIGTFRMLGSASITTDGTGTKTSELRYKPFGEVRFSSGTMPTDRQFTGQLSVGMGAIDFGSGTHPRRSSAFITRPIVNLPRTGAPPKTTLTSRERKSSRRLATLTSVFSTNGRKHNALTFTQNSNSD